MSVSTSYGTVPLVVHLILLCGVYGHHTYWIAPRTSQCGGRTPCKTLNAYTRDNASVFSTSHTRWIFLQGQHHLTGNRYIVIEHAKNITLMGEYPCRSLRRDLCSSILLRQDWDDPIRMHNVTDLVMADMRFSPTEYSHVWLTLKSILNLTIRAVLVDDGAVLRITKPKGSVLISELTTKNLVMYITRPYNTLPSSAECEDLSNKVNITCKLVWVNVIIFNSTFQLGEYGANRITITDTGQYNISHIIPVQCPDSPYIVFVHFSHCIFRNSSLPLELYFNAESPCSKVTISNSVFIHNGLRGAVSIMLNGPHHVEVKNTHFTNNHVRCIIEVQYGPRANRYTVNDKTHYIPSIIIDNCTFVNNIITGSALINIEYESGILSRQDNTINIAFYGNNIFTNNKPEEDEGVDDSIDYNGFHFVIAMNNVFVGISGMVRIEHNEMNVAAMTLSPKSKILLHNNSQLRIDNNGKPETTTQVLVYYSRNTFEKFLKECYVHDCDPRCLFQFVDDNGVYIAEDDLQYFNASIILSNGGSREKTSEDPRPHYLLYNANLQNCTLTLRERNKSIDEGEKRTFLKLDSWDNTTLSLVHPAYHICSCDPTQPEDTTLWDCSHGDITSTVYPGQLVRALWHLDILGL